MTTATPEAPTDETVTDLDTNEDQPTTGEVMRFATPNGALDITAGQKEWTPTQRTALQAIGIQTEGDDAVPVPNVLMFLHVCAKRELDPFLREAYLITHGKRFYSDRDHKWVDNRKYTLVTGIDGFLAMAESTGDYLGMDAPQWCGDDGRWCDSWDARRLGAPVAARVTVHRWSHGGDRPTSATVHFHEFVPMVAQYKGEGQNRQKVEGPTDMWVKMPANQLAKCAKAAALRAAFPRRFSGVYAAEEMERAQVEYQADEKRQQAMEARARRAGAVEAAKAQAQPGQPGQPVEGTVVAHQERPQQAQPPQPRRTAQAKPAQHEPVHAGQAVQEAVAVAMPEEHAQAALRAEVQALAGFFGMVTKEGDPDVVRFTARAARGHKQAYADWSAERLLDFLDRVRPMAVEAMSEQGSTEEAAAYSQVAAQRRPVLDLSAVGLAPEPE